MKKYFHNYTYSHKAAPIITNKYDNLASLMKSLERIESTGFYDVNKYTKSLAHQTAALEYFFCDLIQKQNVEPSDARYILKHRPKIHQLAYFNIGRGYPKELMDGHYCYILNDFGQKMLVVPCTSLKADALDVDVNYEKDILVRDHNRIHISRMQLTELRVVDVQRIDVRKPFLNVVTSQEDIKISISRIIGLNISESIVEPSES